MTAKVYVLQENGYDFSPAEEFGEVHFILDSEVRPYASSQHNANFHAAVNEFITKYDRTKDSIVLTGSPIAIAMFGMMLAEYQETEWNLLRWDSRRRKYSKMTVKQGVVL